MVRARVRLALLWVSQVARVVADWCLRVTTVLALVAIAPGSAWHLATAASIAPFVVLAPFNGCISNGLPRRVVLVGAAGFALIALVACAAVGAAWLPCLAVVAVGSAVYSPARYAVLPAAAAEARITLPRVNAVVEMGGAAAIVFGLRLGFDLASGGETPVVLGFTVPAVQVILALNVLCLFTALPVRFKSDVRRPEPPLQALSGFFRDCQRIGRTRSALIPLLGLAGFQALVTAGVWPLIEPQLRTGSDRWPVLLEVLLFAGIGAGLGCLAAGIQPHPVRSPGLVPYAASGILAVLLWLMVHGVSTDAAASVPRLACFLLGFLGGLVNVPLRAAYMAAVPADARGNGMAVMNFAIYVATTTLSLLVLGLIQLRWLATSNDQLMCIAVLAAVGAGLAWWFYLPVAVECVAELMIWPLFRIRAHGPGVSRWPATGPLLIVANHSAYMDPFWVLKVVPRWVCPMMTSVFYDIPGIAWAMRHLIRAIRVPAATFRREAPELREAIDVLRRGGSILLFPEGKLRRSEEQLLSRFGQGVWHILQALPEATVLVAWIEGGWGSFTSYYNGLPMKNKRIDLWRHIDLAFDEPRVLPPEVLADQWATRAYLMRRCAECRGYLGLPVPEVEDATPKLEATEPRDV